jgi:hypothetical protein
MDEEEWERVRAMSRARYAARLTGWAMRANGVHLRARRARRGRRAR